MDASKLFSNLNEQYIFMERYVNAGSPSGFTEIHTTSERTNPFKGIDRFPLLVFDDSDVQSQVIGEQLPSFWDPSTNYAHPDSINSPIHVNAGRILRTTDYYVSPTSGGRTMFLWSIKPEGYLKLTYDVARIGRVDRQLSVKHCLASYESSSTLKSTIDRGGFPNTLAIQLERTAKVSFLPYDGQMYEWGVIYREKEPYPYAGKTRQLVPGFSLFYGNPEIGHVPLLIQFIRLGGYEPNDYLMRLLKMMVDCYWNIVLKCAFHIESHGQNCLFEVDESYQLVRMVIKDMDSVDKDIPLAEQLGLNTVWESYPQCCFDKSLYYYDIRASFMYDFKLGEYMLTPLIEVVANEYHLNVTKIQSELRDYVQATYAHELPEGYFPANGCWYDCDNTERKPGTQREYYAHTNPKYR